ncbi:MAG: hypothetical protein HYU97_02455 [Deltaproteobacteria bacterium]|nr:hypothetical protein [Deltaproteobacteria bacterium]
MFDNFRGIIDRTILAFLVGALFFTLLFYPAQSLIGLKITLTNILIIFGLLCLPALLIRIRKGLSPLSIKPKALAQGLLLILLGIIFSLSLSIRLQNAQKYPNYLLDSDPYRHEVRTYAMMQTGTISKFDPLIIGETPIFELQGCYVLAALLGILGNFSAWQIWMWGAQSAGALCILAMYLLAKYTHEMLSREFQWKERSFLGLQAAYWAGLIAAALLGASPVHILRTNMGFSEGFALPYFPLTILFYLFCIHHREKIYFILFGLFFTMLTFNNPTSAVFLVPPFLFHTLWITFTRRQYFHLTGFALAAGVFLVWVFIWKFNFLATPFFQTASHLSETGTKGILKDVGVGKTLMQSLALGWKEFKVQALRNLTSLQLFGIMMAWLGFLILSFKRFRYQLGDTSSFLISSTVILFSVLFLIPFGFISFTMYYYRHFIPLAHLSALLIATLVVWLATQKETLKPYLVSASMIAALTISYKAKPWGTWGLNCSHEEYSSARWINQNAPSDAIIIANWFTGDFLRSLTKRQVIMSDYARDEVAKADKHTNLDIRILPKDTNKVIEYIQKNPGTYYLITSKWGPWGKYDEDQRFELLKTHGTKKKDQSKIYRIDPNRILPITTPALPP